MTRCFFTSRSFPALLALLAAPAAGLTVLPAPAYAQAQSPAEQLAAASGLFDAGKYAQAAKALEAFLAANPNHPRAGAAALALGRCRSELKQYVKAVPAYEKALASKDPKLTTSANLGLGEAALQAEQWAKAAGALGAATQADLPDTQASVAFTWLGQADFQLGRYAAAETAYTHVLDKYPGSAAAGEAQFGAGLAALKLDKLDLARQRLRVLIDKFPSSPDRPQALLLLAQTDLEAGRFAPARDGFQAALTATGGDADTQATAEEGLVSAQMGLKNYAEAAAHLKAIVARMAPNDPARLAAQMTLGQALFLQKQYAPAQAAYTVASKSPDPKIAAEALYWAANAALAQGHSPEAAALFSQVAIRDPQSPFAAKAKAKSGQVQTAAQADQAQDTLTAARTNLDAKKYALAATSLTALLATKPAPPAAVAGEAQYLLGLARLGLNKPDSAAQALQAAAAEGAANAPWRADALVQLAWVQIDRKQPALAEKAARAALALPGSPADTMQQARLALLQAEVDGKKWDEALTVCRTLLAASPAPDVTGTVLGTQAWILDRQGKTDAALPGWTRVASEFPQSPYAPDALLHLGDASFRTKQYDAAQAHYADLLAKYPQSEDVPAARLGLGNTLYSLGKFAEAAAAFDSLTADKGAASLRPEGLYWAGLSWEKAGKKAEATARLSRLVSAFPGSPRAAKAKVRLAYLKAAP